MSPFIGKHLARTNLLLEGNLPPVWLVWSLGVLFEELDPRLLVPAWHGPWLLFLDQLLPLGVHRLFVNQLQRLFLLLVRTHYSVQTCQLLTLTLYLERLVSLSPTHRLSLMLVFEVICPLDFWRNRLSLVRGRQLRLLTLVNTSLGLEPAYQTRVIPLRLVDVCLLLARALGQLKVRFGTLLTVFVLCILGSWVLTLVFGNYFHRGIQLHHSSVAYFPFKELVGLIADLHSLRLPQVRNPLRRIHRPFSRWF
jgi:hypothetical protein